MFTLSTTEFPTDFEFEELKGHVTLAFDNVLRMFEAFSDESLAAKIKLVTAIFLITDLEYEFIQSLSIGKLQALFSYLFATFINVSKPVMTPPSESGKREEEFYSITEDADFIYASFMQDYHMDLFEQQGKLHWYKFRALLAGLSDDTKFKQVVSIRQQKPNEIKDRKERQKLIDAQTVYALHVTQEDVEMSQLDKAGQEKYLSEHPQYAEQLREQAIKEQHESE